jgi:hypothetical protein
MVPEGLVRMDTPFKQSGRVIALAAVLIGLAGCSPFGTAEGGPTQKVADAIRGSGSDLIDHVDFISANFLDPAAVNVFLKQGTSDADADVFWCNVVIPAAGAAVAYQGVALWNTDGTDSPGSDTPQC